MSETGFMLLQSIESGMEIILYAVCMTAFFYPFMTEETEWRTVKLRKSFMVFLVHVSIYLIGMAASVYSWLCMVIVIILLVAASQFIGVDKKFTFFLSILFFSVQNISSLILESMYYVFLMTFSDDIMEINSIYDSIIIGNFIVMAMQIVSLFTMLCFAGKKMQNKKMKLHRKELCYLCITPIIDILFGNIILQMFFIVKGNTFFLLYEQYPLLIGLVPLTAALFYIGTMITIMSYQAMIKLQEEKNKYFVEQQQFQAIRERMEEVEQFYHGISRMRHEMKNHLTNIKGLAGSGNYGEMERYIAQMDESMNMFEFSVKTGNAVTDVIVNDKQKAAYKQGIQFKSEFRYPVSDGYNSYDVGIIINNLLQNALEACERMETGKKYILLSGRQKKRFFIIDVRNSFVGEVMFDRNTNLPLSAKENTTGEAISLHGIGLSNVKREADKYLGNVDIKVKKNEFRVTVLLQERRKE
ncbi:MAG: GHKL domain-containing protein [Lachnospiraceae bacterium]|nr:GHKL domain-containing protein [Lachnospiraceae bacterium]